MRVVWRLSHPLIHAMVLDALPSTDLLISDYVVPWGLRLLLALMTFVVGRLVIGGILGICRGVVRRTRFPPMVENFLLAIFKGLLVLVLLVIVLRQLGVDTTSLVALVGAAGLAVGLALQNSLSNFASGVLLALFRPFQEGDFVEAAGVTGVVEGIDIFSTTFRSLDNKEIIVPNGEIYGGVITNYSARKTRRVDMRFGIGYGDDLKRAKEVLHQLLDDPRVLEDPAPEIVVGELGESSVDFLVRPWVKREDYWSFKCDYTERVKLRFDEEGISIPFPQMDVHVGRES